MVQVSLREQPLRQIRPPVTSHPLFPVAVPIWFAALFSLSTLAIRGSLLEGMVLASQLDLVLPMAAPPLGMTARLLVAIAFGAIGALIGKGLVKLLQQTDIAEPRRTATATMADPEIRLRECDTHPDAPARRPISAHAELGEDGLGPVPSAATGFTYGAAPHPDWAEDISHADERPDDGLPEAIEPLPAFLQPHPAPATPALPVGGPLTEAEALAAAWVPVAPATAHPEPVAAPAPQPALAAEPAPAPAPAPHPAATPAPAAPAWAGEPEPVPAPPVAHAAPPVVATPAAAPEPAPAPISPPPPLTAAQRIASAPLESLSHVELIERLAIGMQHRRARDARRRAAPPPVAADTTQPQATDPRQSETDRAEPVVAPPESARTEAGLRAALASLRGLT